MQMSSYFAAIVSKTGNHSIVDPVIQFKNSKVPSKILSDHEYSNFFNMQNGIARRSLEKSSHFVVGNQLQNSNSSNLLLSGSYDNTTINNAGVDSNNESLPGYNNSSHIHPGINLPADPNLPDKGSSVINMEYLESQLELLMKLLRVENDERIERHFVHYLEKTTAKNPLPYPKVTMNPLDPSLWNQTGLMDDQSDQSGNWWENRKVHDYVWPLLPLLMCILVSIIGNILVCLAVWRDKKLQSMTNYFLFSLSIADLGVAAFVMPLALVNNFAGSWVLGPIMCNLWTTMDVTFCTSSILHLCTIQLDRYMAIRTPVRYGEMNRSKKWATIKMFSVWFLSSCVGGTLFTLSLITQGNSYRRIESVYICAIFSEHIMLYGSLAAFYIPFLTMMVLYSLTVYALRQRSLRNKKHAPKIANGGIAARGKRGPSAARAKLYIALKTKKSKNASSTNTKSEFNGGEIELCPEKTDQITTHNNASCLQTTFNQHPSSSKAKLLNSSNSSSSGKTQTQVSTALANAQKRKRDQKENERRAQMVLLIVFVSFVLLWFPFFAINIITPICKSCVENHIDPKWIEFTTWMGYISSMLNPIIYTIFNRLFRDAFLDIILCRNPNQRRLNTVRGRNK